MCVCSAARSPARKVDSSVLSHQGRPMIRIIHLQLLVFICTVRSKPLARQAPLSMESSRQEYWSIFLLHFLLQGIFPTQREKPCCLHCRQFLYLCTTWKVLGTHSFQFSSVQSLSRVRLFASP